MQPVFLAPPQGLLQLRGLLGVLSHLLLYLNQEIVEVNHPIALALRHLRGRLGLTLPQFWLLL